MSPRLFQRSSSWALERILMEIVLILKPFDVIHWFLFTLISMTISTYLNVAFFSTITVNVSQGLTFLILLIIFENITAYCSLKQSLVERTFLLDFVKHLQTKLNQRILSTHWIKIKLSDQVEIRRKIEEASSSVQVLVEEFLDRLKDISKLVMTISTIVYICPMAILLIALVYFFFYRFYLRRKSDELLETKIQMLDKNEKCFSKYSRANANMFEYVIHHEKDHIINITNGLKIDMEGLWLWLDYLYNKLSYQEDMLGKFCIFIIIVIYWLLNGTETLIIPLYHYLSSLTDTIHTLLVSYIRFLRLRKDYDLIEPILNEYEERINAEQIDLTCQLQIEDLSFQYEGKRENFHLQSRSVLTFRMGESILITGKSGAGKSTFYDILNGSIPNYDYSAKVIIDTYAQNLRNLHSIEKCRTMVLQDSDMDYRSTIYSMITNIDEDDVKECRTSELDSIVWNFLHLVQIDDFVRDELNGDLDEPMENKLSGGQKTRLLLARALYRAQHRNSSLLILDEPDKGLPAETTVSIIENIIKWYRSRGILFLTLHTERAHLLNFDQILHIESGLISQIK